MILDALHLFNRAQNSKKTNDMTMEPPDNDVLSGRGAWFNQHPGKELFMGPQPTSVHNKYDVSQRSST